MASLLFASFTNFTQLLFVQPPIIDEYEGLEYSWKIFVFRPALFKYEAFFFAAVIIYGMFFWFGSESNRTRANSWLSAHMGLLEKQFSRPTAGDLTADGYSDFFNFSTGRRHIASLHTVFTLRPRHDLFQLIYQTGWALIDLLYTPKDDLSLDFKLHATVAVPDFVWALVVKEEANSIKNERWDLTFTKTTENPSFPPNVVVMSGKRGWGADTLYTPLLHTRPEVLTKSATAEYADVTESVLKIARPLLQALKDPKIQPYFRSLTITDQPRVRPSAVPAHKEKHVILSLATPSATHAAESVPLVSAVFDLIDGLEKVNLRPETKSKLKKTREEFSKTVKDEAEREAREEAADAKLAAKRRAEEERIASLSAAEQQKLLERDRKRTLRKTQGKVVKK